MSTLNTLVFFDGGNTDAAIIRKALLDKDIARANKLLGHPYTLRGTVTRGKSLGRSINMPTANLKIADGVFIPAHGVYATVTRLRGAEYIGLTHIGRNPTVDTSGIVTIETYLLDFDNDIYDQLIETELHLYIRETRKFSNLDELKKQVDIDIITTRKFFSST